MSINKWKAGLLAGLSILAIGSAAQAGEVRMTVAEYSSKTGRKSWHHTQFRGRAVGCSSAETDHRHLGRHQC
jgi:hypothetical protein